MAVVASQPKLCPTCGQSISQAKFVEIDSPHGHDGFLIET